MQRHLFLDLEDTIIEPIDNASWRHVAPINEEKIKRFIGDFQPTAVHIFSFAIWNKDQLGKFNLHARDKLENIVGHPFKWVLTVDDDIMPNAISIKCPGMMGLSLTEMYNFWGKEETFRYNVRDFARRGWIGAGDNVVLVDDSVINETWVLPDLQITGTTINIVDL